MLVSYWLRVWIPMLGKWAFLVPPHVYVMSDLQCVFVCLQRSDMTAQRCNWISELIHPEKEGEPTVQWRKLPLQLTSPGLSMVLRYMIGNYHESQSSRSA